MRGRNSDKNAIKRLLSAPSTHETAKNKKVHKAQQGRIAPILVISAENQENGQGTHNK
jgi:biotin-(acetyl-CoA carboxylase) ligase